MREDYEGGIPDDGVVCRRCGVSVTDVEYDDNGGMCEDCACLSPLYLGEECAHEDSPCLEADEEYTVAIQGQ